jgi:two-component system, LytTR family, response regulator
VRVRTLIVDDEPLAREGLRGLLAGEDDVEVVGEARSGREAIDAIGELTPDLIFLEIQMPEGTGFDVLETLGTIEPAIVVFVTAYDEYAIRAFDALAFDYLLKPVDPERFSRTLDRARARLRQSRAGELDERLRLLLNELQGREAYPERIALRVGPRTRFVRVIDIDWMEAEGNYIRLHVGERSHLVRETMASMEAKLDPKRFVRIHRSTFVNVERVRELETVARGESVVILRDGTKLTASRGYRDRLKAALGEA